MEYIKITFEDGTTKIFQREKIINASFPELQILFKRKLIKKVDYLKWHTPIPWRVGYLNEHGNKQNIQYGCEGTIKKFSRL